MRKRQTLLAALLTASLAAGPTTAPTHRPKGDYETFDLRPVGEATPPLRYRLSVDSIDLVPGNAAVDYLKAVSLLPVDTEKVVDAADDAHYDNGGRSLARDPAVADLMTRAKPAIDQLVIASRRQTCDWGDAGPSADLNELLARLGRMRQLARLLRVCAIWYGDTLRTADALPILRAEYALAANVAVDQPMIAGLVGLGLEALAHTSVIDAMGRRDAVNLYWPLRTMRHPVVDLKDVMAAERQWIAARMPILKKGRSDDIAPNDWAELIRQMQGLQGMPSPPSETTPIPEDVLKPARAYYAASRHITAGAAAAVDSNRVYSVYQLEQYHIVQDEIEKALSLPICDAMPAMDRLPDKLKGMNIDPANLAMLTVPSLRRTVATFARADRTLAAMTAVEAIRSYAAAHDGKLPNSLADITDTPAPVNPVDGKPFDYKLDGDTATIADETSAIAADPKDGFKLVFTIRVRKP